MKKQLSFITGICFLLISVYPLLLSGCKKEEVKTVKEKTINVRIQSAEKQSLRPFMEATGTLNPNEEVVVSAEVEGILKSVYVDEGVRAPKGMVLAVVDDTDYALEVKRKVL